MIPEQYSKRIPGLLAELEQRLPGTVSQKQHPSLQVTEKKLNDEIGRLLDRMAAHYPFHQPFYAGQMLKPPHPAAWLAYALAMSVNPNNHALDGGPESSHMEKEVVKKLAEMTGFPDNSLGHLTSSGTIANLEALWVARELHPERTVGITGQSHYTHRRMCRVLRMPVTEIPDNARGIPDPGLLDRNKPLPGTIVVTMGTTGMGTVEPLHRMLGWARDNGVRVHVDAAYGGFYHLIRDSGLIDPEPWNALSEADSIVIDPHKHGLQPYGCGSVLFRDPEVGRFYKHDSPYTYFTSDDLHLGEISLECSRAGSAAVALWLTLRLLPLVPITGEDLNGFGPMSGFSSRGDRHPGQNPSVAEASLPETATAGIAWIMAYCREAALKFHDELRKSDKYQPLIYPDLDIVTFIPVTEERTYSEVSDRSLKIMHKGMQGESSNRLYLSTLELDREQAQRWLPELKADRDSLRVLRSVLMKPEHYEFVPEMIRRLTALHRNTRV